MDVNAAKTLRKQISKCQDCQSSTTPKISTLTQKIEAVMWLRETWRSQKFEQLVDASRLTILVADDRICVKHRKRLVRKTGVLFEIEFHRDGASSMAAPTVGKGRFWFTLFWKLPRLVKAAELGKWVAQGRQLGQVVRGEEKMPRMPRKLAGLTKAGNRDKLEWDLESKGYSKVYLGTMGETVVLLRDGAVSVPQGVHSGVPQFTMDEMTRLRCFVGMKPEPEMMHGVWLLKKHLGADVLG